MLKLMLVSSDKNNIAEAERAGVDRIFLDKHIITVNEIQTFLGDGIHVAYDKIRNDVMARKDITAAVTGDEDCIFIGI